MKLLKDRLQYALELRKGSQADLARACHVKAPSVAEWISGKTKTLKSDSLLRASAFLGVNALWLHTGELPIRGEQTYTTMRIGPVVAQQLRDLDWPFPSISHALVSELPLTQRLQLEGAMLLTASQLGIHIARPNDGSERNSA